MRTCHVTCHVTFVQVSCCVGVSPPSLYAPLFLGQVVSKYYLRLLDTLCMHLCCNSHIHHTTHSPLITPITPTPPLSHYTARAFTESLGPDTSEAEALRLLASCEE